MPAPSLRLDVTGLRLRAGGLPRARVLFEHVSFAVSAGERWVVLGPNGAGKSSLLAALAGIFPVDAGRIGLGVKALLDWPAEALAGARAWSPQFWSDPFPATVRETAAMAQHRHAWWLPVGDAPAGASSLESVLTQLDLQALADADVRQLSGGERQRVALATALLQGAPLLLLDEPTSHLDLAHQQLLFRVLVGHGRRGGALVATLHDLNQAWALATHVLLIDGDRILAGVRDDVMRADVLARVYGVGIECLEFDGRTHFVVTDASLRPTS